VIWRVCQLVAACLVVLAGAWLIGWWAVGIVLIVFGLVVAADAVLRSSGDSEPPSTGNAVLDAWRRAK